MADRSRSEIISAHPIGEGLNAFRDTFKSTCDGSDTSQAFDCLSNEGKHTLTLLFVVLYLTDMQSSKT